MTESRRGEPQSTPQTRLLKKLEKARRYDIAGQLGATTGIPDDYWNTLNPILIQATTALRIPTFEKQEYLRDAMRVARTYTQYCIDVWGGDYATNKHTRAHFSPLLEALTTLPNAQRLNGIVSTLHTLAEPNTPIPTVTLHAIVSLALQGYGEIYGRDREEQARQEYYGLQSR